MSSISTLHKVVDLATKRRDDALAALGQAQQELLAATDQLTQLRNYADEAVKRWALRRSHGAVDANLLHHHRQFMEKIAHAIEFQSSIERGCADLVDKAQAVVFAAERDLAGLRKYAQRKQQVADLHAARMEQKATDEIALAVHLRQRQSQTQGLRS